MFHNIADDIILRFIAHKKIDIEEREVYTYGLEVILLNGLLILVFLLISIFTKELLYFFTYLLCFIPLRKFSGGYHAKTSEKCFVYSIVMYIFSIAAVKFLPLIYKPSCFLVLLTVSALIIFIFSPIVNKNNPLIKQQITRNRIISLILLSVDLALLFFLFYSDNLKSAINIFTLILLNALLMIIEKLISTKF